MKILASVEKFMSFVNNNDTKYVVLTSACSNENIYENFYSNFPKNMKVLDITAVEFNTGFINLYVL